MIHMIEEINEKSTNRNEKFDQKLTLVKLIMMIDEENLFPCIQSDQHKSTEKDGIGVKSERVQGTTLGFLWTFRLVNRRRDEKKREKVWTKKSGGVIFKLQNEHKNNAFARSLRSS